MIRMGWFERTVKLVILLYFVDIALCQLEWPVPYRRFESRPAFNSYCQSGVVPFCPTGREPNTMPKFGDSDKIEVYALKAPVFEFKLGGLLGMFDIMHDAMAFKNLNTGFNYTLEWYELVELFNCTFAHVLHNDSLLWCNQGAACIYDGVDDKHWTEHGTLVKVAEISGSLYNKFAEWVLYDNDTAIYYETWTVWDKPGGKLYFDSFDCASFILRAFDELGKLGTKFDQSVQLNYTRINLYSDDPVLLGNFTDIQATNETLAAEIVSFYKQFQSHQPIEQLISHLTAAYEEIFIENKFFFFYNYEYWYLPLKPPHIKLTYYEVPLPKPNVTDTLYFEKDSN
ncbi:ceroid-lipofuscinosis neuronal protein 5 homolog [Mercenaria mercenaria]|uniref:ceroid-lipofuscinosis neuronal protein 5 homolog n=1 Tax=Mercenaria mercenaria TaxID=6596 RepID=UPI00234E55C8|nr:ceroid-lipofuscinosis neuronal protein 5 homolog [Mercenaria mercenaria]